MHACDGMTTCLTVNQWMRGDGVLAPLVVFAASKPTASGWAYGEGAPARYVTGAAGSLSEVG